MKLLYFTNQDIDSGLFTNQVLENLLGLKKIKSDIKITLFIINRPWKYFKHRPIINDIRKKNIKIKYISFCPPMRYFTNSIFLNQLYIFYFTILFRLFINPKDYDVIHCRHYLPSLVCKNLDLNNVLFDIRSLSLFEYVQAGKIKYNSRNYEYWLKQEKDLFDYVNSISVVSKSMIDYIKKSSLNKNISYCPIIVNPKKIFFSRSERNNFRRIWGWSSKNIYVYSGSFGLYGLNKEYLHKLISFIIKKDLNAKFLFLLSNTKSEFNAFVKKYGYEINNFKYYSVSSKELYKYLSASDIGIHSLPNQLDSFTRLGTKIVEYWCIGLPTLINNNIGEASDLSSKYKLGYVINLDKEKQNIDLNFSSFNRKEIRNKSLKLFDRNLVLKNYIRIYKKMINKN